MPAEDALLDQQAPPVPRAVRRVRARGAPRQPRRARPPRRRGDPRQQPQLQQPRELPRRQLVREAQPLERGAAVAQERGGGQARGAPRRLRRVGRGQGEGAEGRGGGREVRVVVDVAQVVEGLVGVLDRDLDAGRVRAEGGHHARVQPRAVAARGVRRQDQELRDARLVRQRGHGERVGGGEGRDVAGLGESRGGRVLVGEEAVGRRVADDRVGRGGGRWWGGQLLVSRISDERAGASKGSGEAYTKKTRQRSSVQSWSCTFNATPPSMNMGMRIWKRSIKVRTAGS